MSHHDKARSLRPLSSPSSCNNDDEDATSGENTPLLCMKAFITLVAIAAFIVFTYNAYMTCRERHKNDQFASDGNTMAWMDEDCDKDRNDTASYEIDNSRNVEQPIPDHVQECEIPTPSSNLDISPVDAHGANAGHSHTQHDKARTAVSDKV